LAIKVCRWAQQWAQKYPIGATEAAQKEKTTKELSPQGKGADNPHSPSSSGLRDVETFRPQKEQPETFPAFSVTALTDQSGEHPRQSQLTHASKHPHCHTMACRNLRQKQLRQGLQMVTQLARTTD